MSEEETCKECDYLRKTEFEKNGLDLYYCNSLKYKGEMEKTTNFKKCELFTNELRKNEYGI